MARTKEVNIEDTSASKTTSTTEEKVSTTVSNNVSKAGPTYDELLTIIQQLSNEVNLLKTGISNQASASTNDTKTDEILKILANRKSDREVVLVHNCELLGGLTTHLELSGLTIDFRTVGEQRILSWQQFEECVSKYRNFFSKQIILLGDEYSELAEQYSIPCVKRGNNHVLTHSELSNIQNKNPRQLEDFINSLTDEDKAIVYSYWLGKCYNKEAGFYDRYKVEVLNRVSNAHVFENMLTLMNGDYRNSEEQ